jgi:hypothetical protein
MKNFKNLKNITKLDKQAQKDIKGGYMPLPECPEGWSWCPKGVCVRDGYCN